MKEFYTQKEFAEELGVSAAYINSLVKKGALRLEDGKISQQQLTDMRGDMLRKYNHLGTLLIYSSDSIDEDTLCDDYKDYCQKNLGELPEFIDNPIKFVAELLSGQSSLENNNYVDEIVHSCILDALGKFIRDYVVAAKRHATGLLFNAKETGVHDIPAGLLSEYVLYGKFVDTDSFTKEQIKGYLSNAKDAFEKIDSYMNTVLENLSWNYKFVDNINISALDVSKHLLVHREDITADFLSMKGDFIDKLVQYLTKHPEYFSNEDSIKAFKRKQFHTTKQDIKDEVQHGYFSCFNLNNPDSLIDFIDEDYYKEIIFIDPDKILKDKVDSIARDLNKSVRRLKLSVKFIDSFD